MELLGQMENRLEVTCFWVTQSKFMIISSTHPMLRLMYSNLMEQTSMEAYSQMLMEVKMNLKRILQMTLQLLFPQLFMISTTAQ